MVFALCAVSTVSHAQSDDLMQREIDRAREQSAWSPGPFLLTSNLSASLGYDSDAFLTLDSPNPDFRLAAAPSLEVAIPLRDGALVHVSEELNFIHYRDFEELRDVINVTRLGGAFGGKNVVVRVDNEFRDEKIQVSRELEVPVDQRSNLLSASISLSLGWRDEMSFGFDSYRFRILNPELLVRGVPVKSLLDRTETAFRVSFTRHLTDETALVLSSFYERPDFQDDSSQRDSLEYGGLAGVVFSPTANVSGRAQLGFKRLVPDELTRQDFSGLIAQVNTRIGLGERLAVEGLYSRDALPSVLSDSVFFISNRYGVYLRAFLGRTVYIRPGFVRGSNTQALDNDAPVEDLQELVINRYNDYSLSINYRMNPNLTVSLGGSYLTREVDASFPVSDRFTVNLDFKTEF